MAAFKVVLFFNQNRYGATETYFWSSGAGGYALCKQDAQRLIKQRLLLLGSGAVLAGTRFEDLGDPGMSEVFEQAPFAGEPDSGVPDIDDPWTGILVNLFAAGNAYRRSLILRFSRPGLANYDPTKPNAVGAAGSSRQLLTRFLNLVRTGLDETGKGTANCWSIRGRSKPTIGAGKSVIKAVRVAGDGSGRLIVNANTIIGLAPGQPVSIHGIRDCTLKGMNGDVNLDAITAAVAPQTGSDYWLHKKQCCVGPVVYTGKGTIQTVSYAMTPISDTEMRCVRVHKTGRRFFGTRGHASKRGCAR